MAKSDYSNVKRSNKSGKAKGDRSMAKSTPVKGTKMSKKMSGKKK